MDLGQWFWGCLTLFFIVVFAHQAVKQIKGTIIHFYFRQKAHYDTERDFDNREQLKRIERLLNGFQTTLLLKIIDSNKLNRDQKDELKKLLTEIINKIDEVDRED